MFLGDMSNLSVESVLYRIFEVIDHDEIKKIIFRVAKV
jgi:hypothetical protein